MKKHVVILALVATLILAATVAAAPGLPSPWGIEKTVEWVRPIGNCLLDTFTDDGYIRCFSWDGAEFYPVWEQSTSECDTLEIVGHQRSALVCYDVEFVGPGNPRGR